MSQRMVKVECVWCGAELERTIHRYKATKKRGSQFTCRDCRGNYRSAKVLGVGHTMVLLPCAACGGVVERKIGSISKRWREGCRTFFCSKSCASLYRRGGKRAKTSFPPRIIPNQRPYG